MTIKSDLLSAQDHISKALISALEKKRSGTASKLFVLYEQVGNLANQFPEYPLETPLGSVDSNDTILNLSYTDPISYGYDDHNYLTDDVITFQ